MRYELGVQLDALDAIDTHVHIEVDGQGHTALPQTLVDAARKVLSRRHHFPELG